MIDALTKSVTILNRVFLAMSAALLAVLAIFMTVAVLSRYLLDSPISWALDFSRAMFAYVVFLALAPTLQNSNHVSMDLIHERMSPFWKYWASTLAWLMVTLFSALLLWKVGEQALSAFETGRRFSGSWAVDAKYIYLAAPLGVAQMLLTGLVGGLRHITRREPVPVWTAPATQGARVS